MGDCNWIDADQGGTLQASAALFYPEGWDSSSLEDYIRFWWSEGHETYYQRAQDTGWQDWNTYSNWTTPELVAEGVTSTFYESPSHPWVGLADDITNGEHVRMWFHFGESGEHDIWEVHSTDAEGSDFGLGCTTSGGCSVDGETCAQYDICDWEATGVATEAICGNATSGCDGVEDAGHGRLFWDWFAFGPVDYTTDDPPMLFTGGPRSEGCIAGGDAADLFRANWNSSLASWAVELDSGCPAVHVEDGHDPAFFPLPGGEAKVYYKISTDEYHVVHWNGSDWEDDTTIEIYFDDGGTLGTTEVSHDCLDNIDIAAFPDTSSATVYEGLFFITSSAWGCFGDAAFIYAERRN